VALFAGVVELTAGAPSPTHGLRVLWVLRGVGAPTVKSAALLSVSTQPPPLRWADVAFVVAAVGAVSEKFAPP
jgi:hypothetical protein